MPTTYILHFSRKYINHLLLVVRGIREARNTTNVLFGSNRFTVHSKPWKMNFATSLTRIVLTEVIQLYRAITFFKTNSNALEQLKEKLTGWSPYNPSHIKLWMSKSKLFLCMMGSFPLTIF